MKTKTIKSMLPSVQYAISHLGKALIWYGMEVYSLFYLTDVLKLPAARIGTLFLAMLAIDALVNLLVGIKIDRIATSKRLNSMIAALTPLLVTTFVLGFMSQSLLPRTAWVIGLMQISRTAFVLVDVPHNTLLLDLAERGQSEVRLAALRQSMNLVAVLLVGAINLQLVGKTLDAEAMMKLALVIGTVGGVLLLTFPRFQDIDLRLERRQSRQELRSILALASKRPVLATLALGLVEYVSNSLMTHSLPYAASRVGNDAQLAGSMLLGIAAIKLAAAPLIWLTIRRTDVVQSGIAIASIFGCAGFCLVMGLASNLSSPFVLAAIGLSDSGMTIIGWTLVMRAYRSAKGDGDDRPASVSALYTSMGRIGSGLSGFLLSGLLLLPTGTLMQGIGLTMGTVSIFGIGVLLVVRRAFATSC